MNVKTYDKIKTEERISSSKTSCRLNSATSIKSKKEENSLILY